MAFMVVSIGFDSYRRNMGLRWIAF